MTILAHTPPQVTPVYPACPTWCQVRHDPHDEMALHVGEDVAADRTHERDVYSLPVPTFPHIGVGAVSVGISRRDWPSLSDGSQVSDRPIVTLALYNRAGGSVTVIPTAAEARAIAAALIEAADLLETS